MQQVKVEEPVEEKQVPKVLTIQIEDNEGKLHSITFDEKIKSFQGLIEQFNEVDKIKLTHIKQPQHMLKFKEFFEKHNYSKTNMQVKKPLISNKFAQNVDNITYSVLGQYQKEEMEEEAVKLIELAEYMRVPEFKNAIYTAVACRFFIGSTEQDLERYREMNSLHQLSVDQEDAIIKEYAQTFSKLQKRFQAELVRLEAELPNN